MKAQGEALIFAHKWGVCALPLVHGPEFGAGTGSE